MAGFVQIIEFRTSRVDEVKALGDEWRNRTDSGNARRGTVAADRDRPGTYFNIVEFDSYEEAMENSNRPETTDFAGRLAALCDGPPKFLNLDVIDNWQV